jgi:hypothetical protein
MQMSKHISKAFRMSDVETMEVDSPVKQAPAPTNAETAAEKKEKKRSHLPW